MLLNESESRKQIAKTDITMAAEATRTQRLAYDKAAAMIDESCARYALYMRRLMMAISCESDLHQMESVCALGATISQMMKLTNSVIGASKLEEMTKLDPENDPELN